jgi:uncharacterized protein
MISLEQIEQDLKEAMKARNAVLVDTLRGLKTRIQNEKVAKLKDLSEDEIVTLVRSEVKRRKDAAQGFKDGNREDQALKELEEAAMLEKYLPAQMSEEDLSKIVDQIITENSFTSIDFGKAMGALKAKAGNTADGALMAKLLKSKLK